MYQSNKGPDRPSPGESLPMSPQVERLYMPAMPPLWLFARIARLLQRLKKRRAIKALLKCDDHLLRDLGYSRGALRRQLNAPGKPGFATKAGRTIDA